MIGRVDIDLAVDFSKSNFGSIAQYYGSKTTSCFSHNMIQKIKSKIRENPSGTTPKGRQRKRKTSAPGTPYYAHTTLNRQPVNGNVKGNKFLAKKFYYATLGSNKTGNFGSVISHGWFSKLAQGGGNWSSWPLDIETTGGRRKISERFRIQQAISEVEKLGTIVNKRDRKRK